MQPGFLDNRGSLEKVPTFCNLTNEMEMCCCLSPDHVFFSSLSGTKHIIQNDMDESCDFTYSQFRIKWMHFETVSERLAVERVWVCLALPVPFTRTLFSWILYSIKQTQHKARQPEFPPALHVQKCYTLLTTTSSYFIFDLWRCCCSADVFCIVVSVN